MLICGDLQQTGSRVYYITRARVSNMKVPHLAYKVRYIT